MVTMKRYSLIRGVHYERFHCTLLLLLVDICVFASMDILYMVPPILKCPVRDNFTCPVRNAMFFFNNDAQATFF